MDPRALKELQRLYAQKQGRATKRRRVDTEADSDAERHRVSRSTDDVSVASASGSEDEPDIALELDAEDDSFDGLSEDDAATATEDRAIEVVAFDDSKSRTAVALDSNAAAAGGGFKSFMSGKIPMSARSRPAEITRRRRRAPAAGGDDGDDEKEDLKNDRELQKLLRESHLLHDQSKHLIGSAVQSSVDGGDALDLQGKARHRARDVQLSSIVGVKKKAAQKMPQRMRLDMADARRERTAKAAAQARQDGIVTARDKTHSRESQNEAKRVERRRVRRSVLGELSVGHYKNGKLTLSKREIERVNGPPGAAAGRGGRAGKRGGKRGGGAGNIRIRV